MNPAALKEPVMHHALSKQKKEDRQDERKQPVFRSERGRLFSVRIRRIGGTGHRVIVVA